jgi:hypothetical protein
VVGFLNVLKSWFPTQKLQLIYKATKYEILLFVFMIGHSNLGVFLIFIIKEMDLQQMTSLACVRTEVPLLQSFAPPMDSFLVVSHLSLGPPTLLPLTCTQKCLFSLFLTHTISLPQSITYMLAKSLEFS